MAKPHIHMKMHKTKNFNKMQMEKMRALFWFWKQAIWGLKAYQRQRVLPQKRTCWLRQENLYIYGWQKTTISTTFQARRVLGSVILPPILLEEVSGSLPSSGEYYYYAREHPRRKVPKGDIVLDPRWRVFQQKCY